jgi:hypothetical protein
VLVVVVFLPKGLLSLGQVPGLIKARRQERTIRRRGDTTPVEPEALKADPEAGGER